MSNEEEKRCPLCDEEMDWTDQQFKPCKCGYQVCVWCWHHITDMAEKDETEGRCPACRSVYEKEKIVAMQANCERTASKYSNRKTRPPKAKPKTNEVKKDLTNIRVIQRKMAYVIGLPISLADEYVLQRKEYFGQYGKVTKVSLSRTAGGAIQQFVNDTCSVYITYSKEEETLRCIQSVHGFVLEDRILRASFGTAKYCHAWLKNMPCNNSACLYLHSIGADEDSFGKDEVAAVHTRSRVLEIVGAANTAVTRSGSVLPPPGDDLYHSTATFPDKNTSGSPVSDGFPGSIDSTGSLPSREREVTDVPNRMTTYVDIVGRSNSSGSDIDGFIPEDRRISNLSTELFSVTIGGDICPVESCSVPTLFKASSTNNIGNGLFRNIPDEPLHEDPLIARQRMKDTSATRQRACFLHPSYSSSNLEDTGGPALMHKAHSLNDFSVNHYPIHNCEDRSSLPIKCVNTVLNDASQEMKFQNSAKSDRIYRNSNSFSNEEIVEHLRRIDDDNSTKDEENSALNVVENSIISNIMSIDFDSYGGSMAMPSGLSELLDEHDGLHHSSWNSFNSDQSGYSFVNQDGFASQTVGSVLPDFRDKKDQYLCKPQYPVTRTQSFAPPGFPVPSRDPPPGFSSSERTGYLPHPSSGCRLINSSLSSNMLQHQQTLTGFNTSIGNIDFNDPAILSCGKPTNQVKTPGFEMSRANNTPQMNTFEDESKLWLLIQQSASACQDSKFSQMFNSQMSSVQQDPSYMGIGPSGFNGLSSRQGNQYQNYDPSSIPQQKYSNGHISNSNGYLLNDMSEFRHKGEVVAEEVERNERLGGLDKYLSGYRDMMFNNSSGDVYGRVFGL